MNHSNIDLGLDEDKNKMDHPISSREKIYAMLSEPMNFEALCNALHNPQWATDALYKRVLAMVRDKQLSIDDKRIIHACKSKLVAVKAQALKTGFMMVNIDGISLMLSERQAQGVFPGDDLSVRVSDPVTKYSVPVVVEVKEASAKHIMCMVTKHRGKIRIKPFDQRIKQHIILDNAPDIKDGDVISVKRSSSQRSRRVMRVDLVRNLGDINQAGLERLIVKQIFDLSGAWPKDFVIEGSDQSDIESVGKDRESWQHLPLVTIDGADAKDYDDAVYAEKTQKGYRLYVAIADVAHYVKEGTDLDKEARARANSVYLPGHVIPMLPEVLSNNACSLLPKVDRLALGAVIDLNERGERISTRLAKVVIRSHARLTYQGVQDMLDKKADVPSWFETPLASLDAVAKALRARRVRDGTIVLRSHETAFSFDDSGQVSDVREVGRVWAHHVIEECMLCANMSVGRLMFDEKLPIIYRCHHEPSAERVEAFQDYLQSHGIKLPASPTPADLQSVLDACEGKPDIHAVEMMVLRTLSQAYYSADDHDHYALSTSFYTHFTSPIRRYVDLTVHRTISAWIDGKRDDTPLDEIAAHCSASERRADEASWFAQAWLKTKWISPYVGKMYRAKIMTVTHFGMFVSLVEQPVEGLVHISMLGHEYFNYQADTMTLVGTTSGRAYGVGQPVKVRLKGVDLSLQRVDFEIAD